MHVTSKWLPSLLRCKMMINNFITTKTMKKLNWLMMLTAAFMLFAVACENEPVPDEPTPTPTPTPEIDDVTFEIEILDTTKTTMTFSVTPSELEADYFCTVMEVADAEDFTKDQYLVSAIYQDLTEVGAAQGLTFNEYMPTILDKGAIDEATFQGLAVDTEYYFIVFAVNASNNFRTIGDVAKVKFATATAPTVECTFEVKPTIENTSVFFDVFPSNKEINWHFMTIPYDMYEYYIVDPEGYQMSLEGFFQQYLNSEINQYAGAGYSTQQIIEALMPVGEKRLSAQGLVAKTKYAWLIAGITIDSDGAWISTDISVGDYTTGDVVPSNMTFEMTVTDVTATRASLKIVPSSNKESYCWMVGTYDGESTAEEVMQSIVNMYGGYLNQGAMLYRGVQDFTGVTPNTYKYKLDAPETKYYSIVFGYAGGITTAPTMVTFETLEGDDPANVEFNMTASNTTAYTADITLTTSSESVYYAVDITDAETFDEETITEELNESMDYVIEESLKGNPDITPAGVLATYYYRYPEMKFTATGLLPESKYMGYIIAFDTKTGHVARIVTFPDIVTTESLGGVSPIATLEGCFSGDQEAGAIFGDKKATAGRAIAVISYSNFEGARSLQTTSVEGDVSNAAGMSDTEVWALCMGYWKSCKVTAPYSFYLTDWNVEMTALVHAIDASNGKPGAIGRAYFKATAEEKKPISLLKELYDKANGTTSAAALPASLVIDETITLSEPTLTPVSFTQLTPEVMPAAAPAPVADVEALPEVVLLDRVSRLYLHN